MSKFPQFVRQHDSQCWKPPRRPQQRDSARPRHPLSVRPRAACRESPRKLGRTGAGGQRHLLLTPGQFSPAQGSVQVDALSSRDAEDIREPPRL